MIVNLIIVFIVVFIRSVTLVFRLQSGLANPLVNSQLFVATEL